MVDGLVGNVEKHLALDRAVFVEDKWCVPCPVVMCSATLIDLHCLLLVVANSSVQGGLIGVVLVYMVVLIWS